MTVRDLRAQPDAPESVVADAGSARAGAVRRDRNSRNILGVNFFAGRASEAVALGLKGGLVVAPAAPALVNLPHDEYYRAAVSGADIAITDSSFMVLLWNLTRRDNIPRVSGLEYLTLLLNVFRSANQQVPFFVMPSKEAAGRALKWLNGQGIQCTKAHFYVAPHYNTREVEDSDLLELLEELRPAHIIIGLGGGTQEKLGLFLRRQLSFRPGIHCIGAAIGFLTGDQVKIPMWADRLYLGWLFRCLDKPTSYIPRYWRARKLFWRLIVEQNSDTRANEGPEEPGRMGAHREHRQRPRMNHTAGTPKFSARMKSQALKPSQSRPLGL